MKTSVVVACLAAIGLTACSSQGSNKAATPTTATTSTAVASSTTATSVANGRVPAYLKTLDLNQRQLTYDQIQFLTGTEAKKAWVKDHPDQPDGPDNDYYILNVNPKLYTVSIAANATVTLANLAKNPSVEGSPASLEDLAAGLKKRPTGFDGPPFWLTISGGSITKIEEQYVP
jgi:hypothetical protein